MAAIWGVIDSENDILESEMQKMQDSMAGFRIDRYDKVAQEGIYFACGHQYFTESAVTDVSPYYDKENYTYFAADVFLYNREELITLLAGEEKEAAVQELEKCGDAILSYRAYRLWGEGFVKYLKGSFAFAIYDGRQGKAFLFADHLARRYLTYYVKQGRLYFATVYQPLLAALPKEEQGLCREWIVSAYTNCTADELRIPGRTVYEKIMQVEPGHYVCVDVLRGEVETKEYWNPLKSVKKSGQRRDEEYRELFLSTFEGVVKSMLRAKGEVGISLSGGLDSASVAAMAAIHLAQDGKSLYSYTAVPSKEFAYTNNKVRMENERDAVLAQKEMYKNIIPSFISGQEINCFTGLEETVRRFCKPVKAALNINNIDGLMKKAVGDGCSLFFTGQNGNATISYGRTITYIYQKLLSGHFLAAYKEANQFCKVHRVPRKRLLKVFCRTWKEEKLHPSLLEDGCFLKKEDIKKYKLLSMEKSIKRQRGTGSLDTVSQRRGFCFMPLVFQHMGIYDTISSLTYGILPLDPTLSKDMIELCLSMPIDCYVKNGRERRAVRDYMKGYVTDAVLENHSARGVQGADYAYRVNRDWEAIGEKVYMVLREPAVAEYLDAEKVNALLKEAKEAEGHMDKGMVAKLAVLSSLAYFLKGVS